MVMAECRREIVTRLSGVNSITACYRAHAATIDQPNSAVHVGTRAASQEQYSTSHILPKKSSAIQHRAHQSVKTELCITDMEDTDMSEKQMMWRWRGGIKEMKHTSSVPARRRGTFRAKASGDILNPGVGSVVISAQMEEGG